MAVEHCFYSVPYALIRQEVEVRLSGQVVEVFHKGRRVASHPRCTPTETGRRRSNSSVTFPVTFPTGR